MHDLATFVYILWPVEQYPLPKVCVIYSIFKIFSTFQFPAFFVHLTIAAELIINAVITLMFVCSHVFIRCFGYVVGITAACL